MEKWVTIAFILIIATTLVVFVMQRKGGFSGTASAASGFEEGTLTVTGVSGRGADDKNGAANLTITGTILGPSITPTEVYRELVVQAGTDLSIGEDVPVVYKPNKVNTTWQIGRLGS